MEHIKSAYFCSQSHFAHAHPVPLIFYRFYHIIFSYHFFISFIILSISFRIYPSSATNFFYRFYCIIVSYHFIISFIILSISFRTYPSSATSSMSQCLLLFSIAQHGHCALSLLLIELLRPRLPAAQHAIAQSRRPSDRLRLSLPLWTSRLAFTKEPVQPSCDETEMY